jgi:hypothetical protein
MALKFVEVSRDTFIHPFPTGYHYMFFANAFAHNYDIWEEARRWGVARFGPDDPDAEWFSHNGRMLFRRLDHAMEFKLRWC